MLSNPVFLDFRSRNPRNDARPLQVSARVQSPPTEFVAADVVLNFANFCQFDFSLLAGRWRWAGGCNVAGAAVCSSQSRFARAHRQSAAAAAAKVQGRRLQKLHLRKSRAFELRARARKSWRGHVINMSLGDTEMGMRDVEKGERGALLEDFLPKEDSL